MTGSRELVRATETGIRSQHVQRIETKISILLVSVNYQAKETITQLLI